MAFWLLTIAVISGASALARFAFSQSPILSVVFPVVSVIGLMAATFGAKLLTMHRRTVADRLKDVIAEGKKLRSETLMLGNPLLNFSDGRWIDSIQRFVAQYGEEYSEGFLKAVMRGDLESDWIIPSITHEQIGLFGQINAGIKWIESLIEKDGKLPASQSGPSSNAP